MVPSRLMKLSYPRTGESQAVMNRRGDGADAEGARLATKRGEGEAHRSGRPARHRPPPAARRLRDRGPTDRDRLRRGHARPPVAHRRAGSSRRSPRRLRSRRPGRGSSSSPRSPPPSPTTIPVACAQVPARHEAKGAAGGGPPLRGEAPKKPNTRARRRRRATSRPKRAAGGVGPGDRLLRQGAGRRAV